MKLLALLKSTQLGDALVRRTPLLYRRYRRLLLEADAASPEGRRELHERLLAQSMRKASASPYARSLPQHDVLSRWPRLEKAVVRDSPEALCLPQLAPISVAETGGTTGLPLRLNRAWSSVVFEQATLDHLVHRFGEVEWSHSKTAVLRGDTIKDVSDNTPPFWRLQRGGKRLLMSSNHLSSSTARAYAEALTAFRPEILWVYPTSLKMLLDLAGDSLRLPSLRLLLSSSEVLESDVRRDAETRLGVKVLDYYGQAERVCLAYSTAAREYYFLCAYGHVEFEPAHRDQDDSFEIIGSSFWNSAQPLMRYNTGDHAILPSDSTPSQREEISLGLRPFLGIVGRDSDYLVAPNGTHLVGIDHIPRGVRDVAQMQFHQHLVDSVDIWVVPKSTYSPATEQTILERAAKKIPNSISLRVKLVDRPHRTARGKTPLVIRAFHA